MSPSANSSDMRMFSRWLNCCSLSYVSVRRSCSTLESVETGMPVRSLICLSVQSLRARSLRRSVPSVACLDFMPHRIAEVGLKPDLQLILQTYGEEMKRQRHVRPDQAGSRQHRPADRERQLA